MQPLLTALVILALAAERYFIPRLMDLLADQTELQFVTI
jgi:hypothetical protein